MNSVRCRFLFLFVVLDEDDDDRTPPSSSCRRRRPPPPDGRRPHPFERHVAGGGGTHARMDVRLPSSVSIAARTLHQNPGVRTRHTGGHTGVRRGDRRRRRAPPPRRPDGDARDLAALPPRNGRIRAPVATVAARTPVTHADRRRIRVVRVVRSGRRVPADDEPHYAELDRCLGASLHAYNDTYIYVYTYATRGTPRRPSAPRCTRTTRTRSRPL